MARVDSASGTPPRSETPTLPASGVTRHGRDRDSEAALGQSDDIALATRLRDADAAALAALYDRYAPAVHGLTRAILRDDRLAEEATHDVFLSLWQHPHGYEPARGTFAGWLLRVARNRAIDLLRRRRERSFAASPVTETGEALDPATFLVDPDPDPADQAASQSVRQDVRRALACLDPDQRQLLELAYFCGLTQREIADHVDRPLGTVKTQIRTAMKHMADVLRAADPSLRGEEPSSSGSVATGWRGEPGTAPGNSSTGGGGGAPTQE